MTGSKVPLNELYDIAPHEAPGLYRVVQELCARAGFNEEVTLVGVHPNAKSLVAYSPGAAISHPTKPKNAIIVNEKMLRDMGVSIDFANYHTIGEDVKGMLAHEIGHLKMGDLKLPFGLKMIGTHSPMALAAASIAALGYIDFSQHQKKKALPSADDVKEFTDKPHHTYSPTLDVMGKTVQYLLTGAGGFVVGSAVSIGLNHHMEYRADRFSKNLMQSGEGMAQILEKMEAYGNRLFDEMFHRQTKYSAEQWEGIKKANDFFRQVLHPSSQKRIEILRA